MLVHSIARKVKAVEHFFQNIYRSASGVMKILILSKFNNSLPAAKYADCIILGNGPSLKQSFEKFPEVFSKVPLVCVNHFATCKEFYQYKPSFYVLLDPGFFILKDRADIAATIEMLKNKVDWELNLFVPYLHKNDSLVKYFKEKKSFVKIRFFNYTILKGFTSLAFGMFKKNLAMPQFYNVLGASIFLAVNMGFKKVWLVGADHSWFKEIDVSSNNDLCVEDKHFYDQQKTPLVYIKDPFTEKKLRIGSFFMALHKTFDSYYILLEYAKYMKCHIYNASEKSYIDAFERKKIEL